MRLKIGNTWYEATLENPIMVELTDMDKENIANMTATASRYAVYVQEPADITEEQLKWMQT